VRRAVLVFALAACGSRPTQTLVAKIDTPPVTSSSSSVPDWVAPSGSAAPSASAPSPDEDAPIVEIRIDAPPRPSPQKYAPKRKPAPGTLACRAEKTPRKESFCILKTADEGALARLLEIGKANPTRFDPHLPTVFSYEASASENAGVIAAKTSERDLVTMLADPDAATEGFALRALAHMMSILRMGYATGMEPDNARRAAIAPQIVDACAPFVGHDDVRVALTAIRCLKESGGARHAALLARVVAAHPSPAVKADAAGAFSGDKLDASVARVIARWLETPMTSSWMLEDVHGREAACWLLDRAVPSRPSWVGRAAAIAQREIWDHGKSNGSNGACRRLAEKTGNAAPGEKPARDWFPRSAIERCRAQKLGAMGQLLVCARNAAAGERARAWSIRIDDPSKLEGAQHKVVADFPLAIEAGHYVDVEHVEHYELSNGFFVFMVPIVRGTPDAFDRAFVELYVLDTSAMTLQRVWKSPACVGCTTQTLQIASRPGAVARTVTLLQYRDIEQPRTIDLRWDGAKLAPR